jgi:hypothetical protein
MLSWATVPNQLQGYVNLSSCQKHCCMRVPCLQWQVERNTDENVQLKILQTALTLLQSPWHPTGMDDIAQVGQMGAQQAGISDSVRTWQEEG